MPAGAGVFPESPFTMLGKPVHTDSSQRDFLLVLPRYRVVTRLISGSRGKILEGSNTSTFVICTQFGSHAKQRTSYHHWPQADTFVKITHPPFLLCVPGKRPPMRRKY